jgi:predicted GH43/DUF377 family glycosyl hydrolase
MSAVQRIGPVLAPSGAGWDSRFTAAPVVWKEEEAFFMLYMGWDEPKGARSFGLARSEDGLAWERAPENPVLSGGPDPWEAAGLEAGSLVKDRQQYWLYYTGFDQNKRCAIGLATSKDLVSWDKHLANPLMAGEQGWEERGVAFPAVVRGLQEERLMVYGAYGPGPAFWGAMQLGTAHSKDGVKWQRVERDPTFRACPVSCWDAGVEIHQVMQVGDQYAMLYEGYGLPGRYNLGVAFSPDGIAWARHPFNPLFPLAEFAVLQHIGTVHPWLLPAEGLLYYTQVDGGVPDRHQICAARFDLSLLDPARVPQLTYELCAGLLLTGGPYISSAIPGAGRSRAMAAVALDRQGKVTVELDLTGGDREVWAKGPSADAKAGECMVLELALAARRVRVRVEADEGTTVTATLGLER